MCRTALTYWTVSQVSIACSCIVCTLEVPHLDRVILYPLDWCLQVAWAVYDDRSEESRHEDLLRAIVQQTGVAPLSIGFFVGESEMQVFVRGGWTQ